MWSEAFNDGTGDLGLTWPRVTGMVEALAKRQDEHRAATLNGIRLAFHAPEELAKLLQPRKRTGLKTAGFAQKPWWTNDDA